MACHSTGHDQTKKQWTCIKHCGACCRLAPDERADALAALNDAQQRLYLSMVGPDGWCIHYDTGRQRCRIYEERPDFCVSGLGQSFQVEDMNSTPSPLLAATNRSAAPMAAAAE